MHGFVHSGSFFSQHRDSDGPDRWREMPTVSDAVKKRERGRTDCEAESLGEATPSEKDSGNE